MYRDVQRYIPKARLNNKRHKRNSLETKKKIERKKDKGKKRLTYSMVLGKSMAEQSLEETY